MAPKAVLIVWFQCHQTFPISPRNANMWSIALDVSKSLIDHPLLISYAWVIHLLGCGYVASGEQVKALLKCYREGDDARFLAVAMQVAADEARKGHGKLAQEIRDLVDEVKLAENARKVPGLAIPMVQPRGELVGLLTVGYPKLTLSDMVLEPSIRNRLQRVLQEQRQEAKLRHHGLIPRSKLLLTGPPGTGKTMTAAALAGELRLPLFRWINHKIYGRNCCETALYF
jgi:hypothetical protein